LIIVTKYDSAFAIIIQPKIIVFVLLAIHF